MYSYTQHRALRKRAKKNTYFSAVIAIVILLIASGLILHSILTKTKQTAKNSSVLSASKTSSNQQSNSLAAAAMNPLSDATGTYAIYIKSLINNQSYSFQEHQSFKSGSLYKLWIMAVVYQQIQAGTLIEDQVLSEDIQTLNEKFSIDPDLAELSDGTITLSVHDALNQMITISHNYAALLLTEKIKLSTVADFLKQNGFNESTVGTDGSNPTTTAFDMGLFFEKLYQGKLANPQYTKEMIDLLKNQQLNNKLPKYLPTDVQVAHKTGELDDFSHDAGMIYTPKGGYIIVAMSESDNPAGAEDRIAQISKSVYDYLGKN